MAVTFSCLTCEELIPHKVKMIDEGIFVKCPLCLTEYLFTLSEMRRANTNVSGVKEVMRQRENAGLPKLPEAHEDEEDV